MRAGFGRRPRSRGGRLRAAIVGAAVIASLGGGVALVAPAQAATPASVTLTALDSGTVSTTWTGTVSPGAGNGVAVNLRCNPSPNPTTDDFHLTLAGIPAGFYTTHTARLVVRIDWAPVTNATVNDLGLTVSTDNGSGTLSNFYDSHQQGTAFESITVPSPAGSTGSSFYHAGACADSNAQSQAYTGQATLYTCNTSLGGPNCGPIPVIDTNTTVAFAPASLVSAEFLGAEPQVNMEHAQQNTQTGAINPNRFWVDWPLSSRTGIGQLSRSTDAGDSFRLLIDPTCYQKSRPFCAAQGGGDTAARINQYDGTVFFADQEALAQESLASSTDHGDSFPVGRQFPVTNTVSDTDRQWLAAVSAPGIMVNDAALMPHELRAMFSYHQAGPNKATIQGIDTTGTPIPQPTPQLSVLQDGPSRVDNTGSHGSGYFYQSFYDSGGVKVAAVKLIDYQDSTKYHISSVSGDAPELFPWLNIDNQGNLYMVWATGGNLYYSYSSITDPLNDPTVGGIPATHWTPEMQINQGAINVGSAIFPSVTAGDAGRAAITFLGTVAKTAGDPDTSHFTGTPDAAPDTAAWREYAVILTNALSSSPTVTFGPVSHRVNHLGNVCTQGTICAASTTADRSFADMMDIGYDSTGRAGVVFQDNNSTFGGNATAPPRGEPFVKFARETMGPGLLNSTPSINVVIPSTARADPTGDATWPNTATGTNLKSLDLTLGSLSTDGTNLIGTINLNDASSATRIADLASFNASPGVNNTAQRLQYVLRFETDSEIYFLSMDSDSAGTPRFFSGMLTQASDGLTNGSTTFAAGYHSDAAFTALTTGSISGNTITIQAPLSLFHVTVGSTPLYSITGFATAGPSEQTEATIFNLMRTVDATPPYDTVLQTNVVPETPLAVMLTLVALLVIGVWWMASQRRRARSGQLG